MFDARVTVQNCQHNTVGDHCEECGRGFHGDATGQTPNDCLVCACPIPALSNNFADSCVVDVGRVAVCNCQPGYVGMQCQKCAPGHFGNPRAIGSFCQECQCNDNIDPQDPYACDDITGRCVRCLNHTAGDSCEVCENSYYGDAIVRKDCRHTHKQKVSTMVNKYESLRDSFDVETIPSLAVFQRLRITDLNKASVGDSEKNRNVISSSHLRNSRVDQKNYSVTGTERSPHAIGDGKHKVPGIGSYGHLIQFSNASIRISPARSASLTQPSLSLMIYGTFDADDSVKPKLEISKPNLAYTNALKNHLEGGFGDAYLYQSEYGIACECNLCGTKTCDHRTGVCGCHPNVIGGLCDQCAPDHWGLDSCQGCQPCQCGLAAVDSQCDLLTGDCECQPGASGRHCDQCQPGYWNLTPRGCQECTCRKGFSIGVGCDPTTGVCSCLPGVQGVNCDGCPFRWVLVDGVGCRECPYCIHTLLDTAGELENMIMPTIHEFESAAHSFFLHQRLNVINESAIELRPLVDGLNLTAEDIKPINEAIDGLGAQALVNNVKLALENAKKSVEEGGMLKEEAMKVYQDVQTAHDLGKNVVAEINALVIGLEIGTGAQLEQALKEGQMIVTSIEDVNLEHPLDAAEEERQTALEELQNITRLSQPIVDLQDLVNEKVELLRDLEDRVSDIEEHITAAHERSDSAVTINSNNREYGLSSLNTKLDQTKETGKDVNKAVMEGEGLVDEADENLANITRGFRDLKAELSEARTQKIVLQAAVETLSKQLEDSELPAQVAAEHTLYLLQRADQLDSLLADTRQVSQNALEAANAYLNIVNAIEDARRAAHRAQNASNNAMELSEGVRGSAVETYRESEAKEQEAELRVQQVEEELKPQLQGSIKQVLDLKNMNDDVQERLRRINGNMTQLEEERGQLNTIEETRKAEKARLKSDVALRTITAVDERQEDDATVARKAFNDGAEAAKSMEFAHLQVTRLEKDIPRIKTMADDLTETNTRIRERSLDLNERLERLKMNIQKTRELTNKVRVGVEFHDDTTIEVIPPGEPSESATSTKFSLYTSTEQPTGLLFFMGTPLGGHKLMRRTKTDDFMALEVVSRVFVGGIPDGVEVANSIRSTSYRGQIEELKINDHTIGLWNFLGNGTNNVQGRGGFERSRLVDLVPPTGLRFSGNGYAAMHTRDENAFHFADKFDISLKFKTFSNDGLLFILRQSPFEFLAVSIVNGHVLFQLNLGSGTAVLQSQLRYNDGQWHRVEAARQGKEAVLKVDSRVDQGMTPGNAAFLRSIPDTMYFGGYPAEHDLRGVTNADFTGCLDEIVMSQLQFDLSKSKETAETLPGCPNEVATLVSFDKQSPGYVSLESSNGLGVKLVVKFRTSEPNGLLFYTSNRDRTAYITLSLSGGALLFNANPGGEISTGAFNQYNDSEWHVVIAAKENNELRLDIDDYDAYELVIVDEQIRFNGPVFFGGVPASMAPRGVTSFSGCIADATLNGQVVDFSNTPNRPNSLLQACDLTKTAPSVFTLRPPDTEESEETTSYYGYTERPRYGPDYGKVTPREPDHYTEEDVYGYYDVQSAVPGGATPDQPMMQQCRLPIEPYHADRPIESYSMDDGARFGNKRDSRIEYASIPYALRGDFRFSFGFKTFSGNGLIFYASTISHTDFLAVYMKEGVLYFSYNLGRGKKLLTSSSSYVDDVWHSVVVEREGMRSRLIVDGIPKKTVTDESSATDRYAPYYFGGVDPSIWELVKSNTERVELSFTGCLKAFRMSNTRVDDIENMNSVSRCSDDVERGVFFGLGKRSHIILRSRFSVGHQFQLTMEVKPRVNNAVIMSIHGRRDFLLLQLSNGSFEFSADNGRGIIKAAIAPIDPYAFCDGNWHRLEVAKLKNLVVITVDGISASNSGTIVATSTDTRHPLFLGSQPRLSQRRGQPVLDMFVGCIRNVTLGQESSDLGHSTFVGNVNAGSCPID
ncbi:Laminin G domain [Trinorchestia longiramus]|nr:Laminin G domain [Trinorchestia longiramus]